MAAAEGASTQRLVVGAREAILFDRCSERAAARTRLPAGHEVVLRFAIAGESQSCYAVWTKLDGETLSGYIPRHALEGNDAFEQKLREASAERLIDEAIKTIRIPSNRRPVRAAEAVGGQPAVEEAVRLAIFELEAGRPSQVERILANARPPAQSREAALLRAEALLQLRRPRDALEVLGPALAAAPSDPGLLGIGGLSAYLADEPHRARKYLRQALEMTPNEAIAGILSKLERELGADESNNIAYGARIVLRYESGGLRAESSRSLVRLFEAEASRISAELGCPVPARLAVIVQSTENYRSATGSADWSAGHYDGRIRIAAPSEAEAVPRVREVFAHEYVHACLAGISRWPTWFHEGMAQRLSGVALHPAERSRLRNLAQAGALPSLDELGEDWSTLNTEEAAAAYALSLAAVNLLYETLRPAGIRNVIQNPDNLGDFSGVVRRELTRGN